MPVMETVTIINKSGKVVSTGKQLVNIFKDAKDAYNEKKAELKFERRKTIQFKAEQKLLQAREETRSVASSHHSHRSHSSRHHHRDRTRPPLTERALTHIEEGSVASSRRSRGSQPRSRRAPSPDNEVPYFEEILNPGLIRRHTDFPDSPAGQMIHDDVPPAPIHRSASNPEIKDNIDMNLAYGELHHPPNQEPEMELEETMTKLDSLLLEAHCVQHSATAVIANLQSNPEAMAAVALTLAELSNIVKSMGPSILTAMKASSPIIFALLASPQFLIAGGVALGVTIVMFGGFKIIKQIQANNEAARKEASQMEEAMVYDSLEMGSIESWRRGIADVEERSVATSIDGEFITPEAARQKKEQISERAKEERIRRPKTKSVVSERSVRRRGSASGIRESTLAPKEEIPPRLSSRKTMPAQSESGRTNRSHKSSKSRELVAVSKDKEKKKNISPLAILFKKNKDKKEKESSEKSHRPKLVDI